MARRRVDNLRGAAYNQVVMDERTRLTAMVKAAG